jgi:hypothetical protein
VSNVFNYGLVGVSGNVELGKGGPRVVVNGTGVDIKNAANNALAILSAAEPTAATHVATKAYVDRLAAVFIKGQMKNDVARNYGDTGVLTPVEGDIVIVTTVGTTWDTLKRLLVYRSAAWVYLFPAGATVEGLRMSVPDAITGGTDTYLADHVYMWDEDATVWVDIGPAIAATNVQYGFTVPLADDSTSPLVIKANAVGRAVRVKVQVTVAFDGTAPTLAIGDSGNAARLMATTEVNLKAIGLYIAECYYDYTAPTDIRATYVADSSANGDATITVEVIN